MFTVSQRRQVYTQAVKLLRDPEKGERCVLMVSPPSSPLGWTVPCNLRSSSLRLEPYKATVNDKMLTAINGDTQFLEFHAEELLRVSGCECAQVHVCVYI